MNYLVVSHQRTGSSLLHQYVMHKNDLFGFHDIFLDSSNQLKYPANDKWYYDLSVEEKFNLLETCKKREIYIPWKCFPSQLLVDDLTKNFRYIERFRNLLSGYKLLTIDRDPWDTFLSHSYQDAINWETTHKFQDHSKKFIELDSFEIRISKIPYLCMKWKTTQEFIDSLDIYHTFRYNELTINNLKEYFQTDWDGWSVPNEIDYESIATNLKEAKEIFDYEMYGARNRNNN
jgi:hypothetical protein